MNFPQSLDYLEDVQKLGVKFGLDNVKTVLAALGHPEIRYPCVLVAGTNGKGSVSAMLTHILTLHGFRVGLFTSPHLVSVRERIRIGGQLISKRAFSARLTLLRERIEELLDGGILPNSPTYFEILSCLAFLHFKREGVDIAVMEVGMGGRFDATNVVDPLISVITTISPEHQKALGHTPAEIAFEKSGIMRPGVPVVCGTENPEALAVLEKRAGELGAPFLNVFQNEDIFRLRHGGGKNRFVLRTPQGEIEFVPALRGGHQGKNAAVALTAAQTLSERWRPLRKDLLRRGVETADWPGRLEVFHESPLVLLDGAHNQEGALALKTYIKDSVPQPVILVFALMRDKSIENIAGVLFPLAEKIFLTRFPYFRAAEPHDILKKMERYREKTTMEPDTAAAVLAAVREARESGRQKTVIVAGSLFLVGEVKKLFPRGL